jgi:TRAP-type C4-dicarboxylate transport system permease large subunit
MNRILSISLLLLIFFTSSCQVVGDIFKAGVWVGVLMVVGIIALVIYLVNRGPNKN